MPILAVTNLNVLLNEIKIMKDSVHKHIVGFIGCWLVEEVYTLPYFLFLFISFVFSSRYLFYYTFQSPNVLSGNMVGHGILGERLLVGDFGYIPYNTNV